MEQENARAQAADALRAFQDAARPAPPTSLAAVAACCAGLGVLLLGQGRGLVHLLSFVVAAALLAEAFLLPDRWRRRRGLVGYRGRVRSDHTTFLVVAVALAVIGFNAEPVMHVLFIAFGVASGIAWFWALRRRPEA